MSDHDWCRDTARDEAIRAAEDAAAVPAIQHRDLPEQVALLWASVGDLIGRVVRLEGEMDAGQNDSASPAEGLRTERVTLEITHRKHTAHEWAWPQMIWLDEIRGESVRVVEETAEIALRTERVTPPWQRAKWDEALAIICDGGDWGRGNNFDHGVLGALVIWADKEMDRLTAERDAALRERDAAQSQCEELERAALVDHQTIGTLRARVAELERDRRPATWQEEEAAVEGAWLLCGLEPDWPSDEPGTIVRHAESMRREVGRLRDRVAELERADSMMPAKLATAANAGGESNPGDVSGDGKSNCQGTLDGSQEPVAWGVLMPNQDVRTVCLFRNTEEKAKENFPPSQGWTHFPLYSAPQPPRGWLTAEERELIAGLADDDVFTEEGQNIAKALLARETPPRVKVPNLLQQNTWQSRDSQWIAAIREAGGEVE